MLRMFVLADLKEKLVYGTLVALAGIFTLAWEVFLLWLLMKGISWASSLLLR